MWILDMSMQQLWFYLKWPFRKIRELWNREPDWAEDEPGFPERAEAAAEEEPEFLLPEAPAPKLSRKQRKTAAAEAEPVPDASDIPDIPDFVEDTSPLPPDLDAIIRDSYSQPQDNTPYEPAYDMDIDIPIPEDEPDNPAIVSPEELMQDPPELVTESAPAAAAHRPSRPRRPRPAR